ncbi:platelet-activating factor acetylhydrolase isoform II [Haloactinospora alba]|uniref:Platelet-activating factor acetylhydrolase isoform II n=1 Tax=Haloactinospora alba TaxID=405555 RepID=A0A543NN75_9ACTN|nr:alpha/beta hydrolase [Haloactinospora alba]TQN33278.1 platelet-activating factor acetylhydrolase isoform II [Haloactinospora alba]
MTTLRKAPAPPSLPRLRAACYSAAVAVLAAACAVPPALAELGGPEAVRLSPPEPTGPHPVGRATMHLIDEDRADPWNGQQEREIMTSLWYPAAAEEGEPAPYVSDAMAEQLSLQLEQAGISRGAVDIEGSEANATVGSGLAGEVGELPTVLYSPGMEVSRHQSTAQAEELASRGYLVVTMDHTYEGKAVEFPDGRVKKQDLPEEQEFTETYRTAVKARKADARLVLDSLERLAGGDNPDAANRDLPEGLGEAVDLSRIGMFGHSAGGFTAAEVMLTDERVDAGINLDGSLAYHVGDEEWGESTTRGVERPFLILGAGTVSNSGGSPHTSRNSPDWAMFRDASPETLELYMERAEHMSYLDTQWILPQLDERLRPDSPSWDDGMRASVGTIGPEASVAAQRAYITAYLDEHVRGVERPLLDGPSDEHPEVEFVE